MYTYLVHTLYTLTKYTNASCTHIVRMLWLVTLGHSNKQITHFENLKKKKSNIGRQTDGVYTCLFLQSTIYTHTILENYSSTKC
jgi:hypothetical protein